MATGKCNFFWTALPAAGAALWLAACSAPQPPWPGPRPEDHVYRWLVRQQQPSGLLGNQEQDNFSGVYSVALAAIAYVHQGDTALAERAFDAYARRLDTFFAAESPGGFPQFWDAASGEPHPDTDRWLGDNAWLLIALNIHRQRTSDTRYDEMRAAIARWILSLQNPDGGVRSGYNREGPMTHISTEGNLDAYAALIDFPEAREKIRAYLMDHLWVADGPHFRMGSTVEEPALDGASWGVAALGRALAVTLDRAEETFGRTDRAPATGQPIKGFADFVAKQRIWLEGTGQMVVAYRAAGDHAKADFYLAELEKALIPSHTVPGAVGLPCTTSDPPWAGGDATLFVPSQAWYLFGKWGFNPLSPEPVPGPNS